MPVGEADLGLDVDNSKYNWVFALVVFVGLWFFSLKQLFGSYSIFRIFEEYKERKLIDAKYNRLFETRDNLCHHISWARSRGEKREEVIRLVVDLKACEAAIDELELKHYPPRGLKKKQDC